LNLKATKQSVTNALNRKINRSDLDVLLIDKASKIEVDELQTLMNNKVNNDHFEIQFAKLYEFKISRQEINNLKEMMLSKIDTYK